jgi:hypothetical protein
MTILNYFDEVKICLEQRAVGLYTSRIGRLRAAQAMVGRREEAADWLVACET